MRDWSESEKQWIQSELDQYLSPELICSREESYASKLYYLSIQQAQALANEVFGSENWTLAVRNESLEYTGAGEPGSDEFTAGATCCVRVTLRNGAFREDVGFSQASAPSKDDAIRKAKSIAKSDATKRAFRQFGNTLGNCLYDHEFTQFLATLT